LNKKIPLSAKNAYLTGCVFMVSTDRFGLLKIFGGGSYYNNGNVLFFSKYKFKLISSQ